MGTINHESSKRGNYTTISQAKCKVKHAGNCVCKQYVKPCKPPPETAFYGIVIVPSLIFKNLYYTVVIRVKFHRKAVLAWLEWRNEYESSNKCGDFHQNDHICGPNLGELGLLLRLDSQFSCDGTSMFGVLVKVLLCN